MSKTRSAALRRATSMLVRDAMRHDMDRIRAARRAAERTVTWQGQGGAICTMTVPRSR